MWNNKKIAKLEEALIAARVEAKKEVEALRAFYEKEMDFLKGEQSYLRIQNEKLTQQLVSAGSKQNSDFIENFQALATPLSEEEKKAQDRMKQRQNEWQAAWSKYHGQSYAAPKMPEGKVE